MIVRTWRGWTAPEDADAYVDYLNATGIPAHRATPGNRCAWILRSPVDGRVEFVTLSFWDSMAAVRTLAGDEAERAVFYPENDRCLVDRKVTVHRFELFGEGLLPG